MANRLADRLRIVDLAIDERGKHDRPQPDRSSKVKKSYAGVQELTVQRARIESLADQEPDADLSSIADSKTVINGGPGITAQTQTRKETQTQSIVVPRKWLLPRFVAKTYIATSDGYAAAVDGPGDADGADGDKDHSAGKQKLFVNVVNLSPYMPASELASLGTRLLVGVPSSRARDAVERADEALLEGAATKVQGCSATSHDVDRQGKRSLVITLLLRGANSRSPYSEGLDTDLCRRLLDAALAAADVQGNVVGAFTFPSLKHGANVKGRLDDIVHVERPDLPQPAPSTVTPVAIPTPTNDRGDQPAPSLAESKVTSAPAWRQVKGGPAYRTTPLAHPIQAHPLPSVYTHQLVVKLPLRPTAASSADGSSVVGDGAELPGSWSIFYDPSDTSLKVLVPPLEEFCEVYGVKQPDYRAFIRDELLYVLYTAAAATG